MAISASDPRKRKRRRAGRGAPRKSIGEILRDSGLLTPSQLEAAIAQQRRQPSRPLGVIVSELGFATQGAVDQALKLNRSRGRNLMGRALVAARVVTMKQLNIAVQEQKRNPKKRLGTIIVEKGYATEEEIQKALNQSQTDNSKWMIGGLAGIAVVLLVVMLIPFGGEDETEAPAAPPPEQGERPLEGAQALGATALFKPELTPAQAAVEYIADYQTQNAQSPQDEELVRLNLRRMGNLYYSDILDYEKASASYEELIRRFPDWDGINDIYPNLAQSYEFLGERSMARATYERMLDVFPEDSPYYLMAQQKLAQ